MSQLSRRGLFGLLAGAALDPEWLLWKPSKLISIPKPAPIDSLPPGRFAGYFDSAVLPAITEQFWKLYAVRIT